MTTWAVVGAILLLTPYWLGPLVVWLRQKSAVHPTFEPFDPGSHKIPDDVERAFRQTGTALREQGFHLVADLFQAGQVKHVVLRVALFEHPVTQELAIGVVGWSTGGAARIVAAYVEFPIKFGDGRNLLINNNRQLSVYAAVPHRTMVRFPDVRDPRRLYRICCAYVDRYHAGVARVPYDYQGAPARFLTGAMVREMTEQVETGYLWRDERAQAYRPTFRGAWRMTWRLLPPFSWIAQAKTRRRQAELLQELGMQGSDERPIAVPRTKISAVWLLILAASVLLLMQVVIPGVLDSFQGLVRSQTVVLPSDFVVPNDFSGAVRALERLAGTSATPLLGTDTLGAQVATGGFDVPVPLARAEGLVTAAQQRFLERGFYLFRSQRNYGIGGEPDRVALFPGRDPYRILLLVGTNGWNYDIGPDSVAAWLRALERDQPFVLTGIGFDWVEGRFTTTIADAEALARRFSEFCPDIVTQGSGSVAALARELRRTKLLYCWWD